MATRFQDYEDPKQRRTWEERDGMAYRRVYLVPVGEVASGQLPAEGAVMPGESATVLGPFIEKDGIEFGKKATGNKQEVILKCKLLKARS